MPAVSTTAGTPAPRAAGPAAAPADHDSELGEHLETIVSGRLRQALLLTLLILVVELAGGVWSHSLALLSDAGHVTTDVFALGLAWFAVKQATRPADEVRSYGYHRAGILAAMANGATLILLVFVIAWEAAQRLVHPEPVQGGIVMLSAVVGVAINAYIALGFRANASNLNIRAAILHAVGDLTASIGVIVAGAVILFTGWLFIDPLVSILIAALIGWNAFNIVRETVNILLEGTPRGMDLSRIREALAGVEGVTSHHDLHVWSISSEHLALSAHVVVDELSLADSEHVMREIESRLCDRFGIGHTTIQVEFCHPCTANADHLAEHNHPHAKLARQATTARRRTPLSRRRARA
jgi:cobalt-zinc-cadmium efflux system protein